MKTKHPPRERKRSLPDWFKKPLPTGGATSPMRKLVSDLKLNTVCESAKCPNLNECWSRKTATFMVLGNHCTRRCFFCSVPKAKPDALDADEPRRVAEAVQKLDLRHVVITHRNPDSLNEIVRLAGNVATPLPSRGQKLRNDDPSGEDLLGIKGQVEALADAIALRDMEPPLVVGVLGGWGAGKSFVMHLLEERLRWIRSLAVPAIDQEPEKYRAFPYVGHPYIVHFDAWTYAKSDLWASLMQRILQDLNEQLSLEELLAGAGVDACEGVDLWALMSRLSMGEREAFGDFIAPDKIGKFLELRAKGDAEALWDVLKTLRSEETTILETVEAELETQRAAEAAVLRPLAFRS